MPICKDSLTNSEGAAGAAGVGAAAAAGLPSTLLGGVCSSAFGLAVGDGAVAG
ncbi:MAG: hypothetical protein M0036_25600 [Desulfobacteraceae bacterium]|nr:hypothetical protein [Desulfobacteraceae bacterium]